MDILDDNELDVETIEKYLKSCKRGIRTNYKGRIAEKVVKLWLESQGYLITKTDQLREPIGLYYVLQDAGIFLRKLKKEKPPKEFGSDDWSLYYDDDESKQLLQSGADWETYRKYMIPIMQDVYGKAKIKIEENKKLREMWGGEEKLKKLAYSGKYSYQPDLLAKKDGKIYIVEVKSSKSGKVYWHGNQRDRFDDLRLKHGFSTILVSIPIHFDIDISVGKPKIVEISG